MFKINTSSIPLFEERSTLQSKIWLRDMHKSPRRPQTLLLNDTQRYSTLEFVVTI